MGQYNKVKHVAFEDVEAEAKKYATISEEIRTIVEKEKRNKTPKRKMAKDISLLANDEELVYQEEDMLTDKKKKSNLGQLVKVMSSSEEQTERSKGSREIITPGAELEDGIIKTKQNTIRSKLKKNKLICGGQTLNLMSANFVGYMKNNLNIKLERHITYMYII